MTKKYIKIVTGAVLLMLSAASNSHDSHVNIDRIYSTYTDTEFTIAIKFSTVVSYDHGKAWPGVSTMEVLRNKGKKYPMLMYLVDGHRGLTLKASGLDLTSKLSVAKDEKNETWWRAVAAVNGAFMKETYTTSTRVHPVALERSNRAINDWVAIELTAAHVEGERQKTENARIRRNEARIEKIKLVAKEGKLLVEETLPNLLRQAVRTRIPPDISTVKESALNTKQLLMSAKYAYTALELRSSDNLEISVEELNDSIDIALTKVAMIATQVSEIAVLTEWEIAEGQNLSRLNKISPHVVKYGIENIQNINSFYVVKILRQGSSSNNYIKVTSTKSGNKGNGSILRYSLSNILSDKNICRKNNATPVPEVTCGALAKTNDLVASINNDFVLEGFEAEKITQLSGSELISSQLSVNKLSWTLSGGITGEKEGKTYIVSFTPAVSDGLKIYTIVINASEYSIPVDSLMSINDIVQALQFKVSQSTEVFCSRGDVRITCRVKGEQEFTHSVSVVNRETETESDEEKEAANAQEKAWKTQLAIVGTSLITANDKKTAAETSLESDDTSVIKLTALEVSKQANASLLIEIHKLNHLKRAGNKQIQDGSIVANFTAQHAALDLATKALRETYAQEVAWEHQKFVVETLSAEANTAKVAAADSLSSESSLPESLALIEAAEGANALLFIGIQMLTQLSRGTTSDIFSLQMYTIKYQEFQGTVAALLTLYKEKSNTLWLAQYTVVEAFLVSATKAKDAAESANQVGGTSDKKELLILEAEQANLAFFAEIGKLSSLKRTRNNKDSDIAAVKAFIQRHKVLKEEVAKLRRLYLIDSETLTGYWKFPVIKGLNYASGVHTAVTDENGAFKCQPGETVNFSIASLFLTTTTCTAIGSTKITKNLSLSTASSESGEGFKDWQDEEGKQVKIIKVLFGLFGDAIRETLSQESKELTTITIDLTDEQRLKTEKESLLAQDLSLLVQNILGADEMPKLLTTEEAFSILAKGWEVNNMTKKQESSGGGCVYNANTSNGSNIQVIFFIVLISYYLIRRRRLS